MSNPYEDFDPINPWDDDTGDFSFVEDEYDAMDLSEDEDPFVTYSKEPYDMSAYGRADDGAVGAGAVGRGSTEAFPKTMVRPAYGEPAAYGEPPATERHDQPSQPGVLHRRKGAGRRVGDGERAEAARRAEKGRRAQPAAPAQPVGYPQPPVPGQHVSPKPPRRRRRRHGCLVTLLLMAAAVVGLYWLVAHPIDDRLAFAPEERQTLSGTLSWSVPGMPYYLLALGSDAREGETYSRTDTMVLMRVDLVGGKLTMVSIPRDTMVDIEGVGTAKINAAYAYGGAGGAVREVSELTGVPIHHVAVIHFEELVGLIDYLGGVTVNVPVGVDDPYTGLSIESGLQTMDGSTALAWARSRYGYETGDFQRQADQRILIEAIMNRLLSLSPREIPGAFGQLGGLIGTDMRCYDLVPLFVRFRLGNPQVYSCTLPTASEYVGDQWYEIADEAGVAHVMQLVDAGADPSL